MFPHPIRSLALCLACCAVADAQTATPASAAGSSATAPRRTKPRGKAYQAPFNPNVVVLDPGHGGDDNGADLGRAGQEKDFNQAFAVRLRDLLTAQGFIVVLTHAASTEGPKSDLRAELANRSHAVACLLLHSTASGEGVHLFTSSLAPQSPPLQSSAQNDTGETAIPLWDSAQAFSLSKSLQLANELSSSFNGMKLPLAVGSASVSPIDSMVCPAVALEIAAPGPKRSLTDEIYQQHIAESVTTTLVYWRQRAKDQIAAAEAALESGGDHGAGSPPTAFGSAKPKPKPKPSSIPSPDESPLAPDGVRPSPAPIERKAPPPSTTPPPDGASQ